MTRLHHLWPGNILRGRGVEMFRKIIKQFEIFRELNTSGNRRADIELMKSRAQNNPSFALINAWAILENQVQKENSTGYWNAPTKSIFIVSHCANRLGLNNAQQEQMRAINRMRNGVAHAISDRNIPSWSDVDFIINVSRRLRLKGVIA